MFVEGCLVLDEVIFGGIGIGIGRFWISNDGDTPWDGFFWASCMVDYAYEVLCA